MSNIREVARAAQVSPATVSRVLNNDPTCKITAETRQRVLKAVTDLDYKFPVGMARRTQLDAAPAMHRICCLLAATKGKYSDPYYMMILSGMEEELMKRRCMVSIVRTEQELEIPGVLDSLLSTPLDGLVMMRSLDDAIFSRLQAHVPHIVGIDTGHMPIDNIEYDHRRVSRTAVEYLYGKGYRQIGFIGSGTGSVPIARSRRFRGYCETMQDLSLPVRPEWVLDCGWDEACCMAQVEALCAENNLPKAFFAASDLMAMAALRALSRKGIHVPDQVAVMGLTDIEVSQYANPPLTTIHISAYEMGQEAARVLAARIEGDASLPRRILLPSTLIERESV